MKVNVTVVTTENIAEISTRFQYYNFDALIERIQELAGVEQRLSDKENELAQAEIRVDKLLADLQNTTDRMAALESRIESIAHAAIHRPCKEAEEAEEVAEVEETPEEVEDAVPA